MNIHQENKLNELWHHYFKDNANYNLRFGQYVINKEELHIEGDTLDIFYEQDNTKAFVMIQERLNK